MIPADSLKIKQHNAMQQSIEVIEHAAVHTTSTTANRRCTITPACEIAHDACGAPTINQFKLYLRHGYELHKAGVEYVSNYLSAANLMPWCIRG